MNTASAWAEAIGVEYDAEGQILLDSVIAHVRCAILETGFVSRGRITAGLKEAYRPLGVDEAKLRQKIDEALCILQLSGDLDEFATGAGRGYAATPPRRVDWGCGALTLLGGVAGGDPTARVRRISAGAADASAITLSLDGELGRPAWRSALVELGGTDAPEESAAALFDRSVILAANGERFSLDEPQTVAVLSGRGRFFGHAENAPSGRWHRPNDDGCFPAVIKARFSSRYVILDITAGAATVWQPPSRDLWRWLVVGATLAAGDPVLGYDSATRRLDFLTPPPRQAERGALLAGIQVGPWSWEIEPQAYTIISRLSGAPR